MIKKISKDDLHQVIQILKPFLFKKNIILSANFYRIGLPDFSLEYLIKSLINDLQCKYLAIQSYSEFKDRNSRYFSRYSSPVSNDLSTLSKYIFSKYPQYRILSPTHSFIIFGLGQDKLDHLFTSAFGKNSSFSYFLEEEFSWLNFGSLLSETCTFMHHVESCNLNYIEYRHEVNLPVIINPDKNPLNTIPVNYIYLDKVKRFSQLEDNWRSLENHESFINNKIKNNYFPINFYDLEELMVIGSKIIKSNPFELTTFSR